MSDNAAPESQSSSPPSCPASQRRRPKTEKAADIDTDAEWKRHPDLYFEDGSVVLLAEDTLFRVYLRWLGKHSEVFSQMSSFSTIQPADSESYDGCPLVRLTDTADDLAHFLNGMDGCSSFFSANKPTPFRAVAGILRLASKYMVTPLQDKAVDHLCLLYPTKFEDMNPDHKNLRDQVFGSASKAPEHPIVLVNLLRSCQITKLLPWAYYAVVRWSYRDMVIGYKLPHGGVVRLSDEDMQLCLLGFETLMASQHANIKHLFKGPSPKCTSWSSCAEGISDAYTRALDEHGTGLIAPLGPLRRKIAACERCVANIKRMDEEKRKEVWQQLPGVFGLPPWSELQA